MRSEKPRVVAINASKTCPKPMLLWFLQRHLEKAKPPGDRSGDTISFRVPVDLLTMTLSEDLKQDVEKEIEEVALVYSTAGKE